MNRINEEIKAFEDYFKTMTFVDRNGGLCIQHPDQLDIGMGQGDCKGNTYGQDDGTKVTAYFTVRVNPTQQNRIVMRKRIEFNCKLFYNNKNLGYDEDDYSVALAFQEFISKKYRITPTFRISGTHPRKKVDLIVFKDVYDKCGVTIEDLDPVC